MREEPTGDEVQESGGAQQQGGMRDSAPPHDRDAVTSEGQPGMSAGARLDTERLAALLQQARETIVRLQRTPPIVLYQVRGVPVLIVLDVYSGIEPWDILCAADMPLLSCPVLFKRPGTQLDIWDFPALLMALQQLPADMLDELTFQLDAWGEKRHATIPGLKQRVDAWYGET